MGAQVLTSHTTGCHCCYSTMVFRSLLVFAPACALAIHTPQGERADDCVLQVPEGAVVKATETGVALHHPTGIVDYVETPVHCHTDNVAINLANGGSSSNQWIDEASFTYNAGFSKMTGYNNITDA